MCGLIVPTQTGTIHQLQGTQRNSYTTAPYKCAWCPKDREELGTDAPLTSYHEIYYISLGSLIFNMANQQLDLNHFKTQKCKHTFLNSIVKMNTVQYQLSLQ